MKKKWLYLGNYGVLAVGDQIEQIEKHCSNKPDDYLKFEHVSFNKVLNLIKDSKDYLNDGVPEQNKELEEARKKAESLGLKVHHKAKLETVLKAIEEAEKQG